MNRVSVDFANCYGIKELHATFDFSQSRVYAIYAPNGVMKSSLAETFGDVAKGVSSTDRIFPARQSVRQIVDENGKELPKESIFVVRPYDREFGHNEKTSTLLLDPKLRKEYELLYAAIDEAKEAFLKALKEQSHTKKPIEQEIAAAFSADDFYTALHRIRKEVEEQTETPFADVQYDVVFDDKVLSILKTEDVQTALADYITRYNELLDASLFFKKGTFDYYNAGQIAKSLAKNGFFDAQHTIYLKADTPVEIHSQKELEAVIAKEKETILKDKDLRKQFDKISALLEKNETLRGFQSYMLEQPALLAQLSNVTKFKQNIWKSYLKVKYDLYLEVVTKHEAAEKRRKEIEEEARKQRTQWGEVIQIFNERFVVPFKLEVKNWVAVMLGLDPIIDLGFTYYDGLESAHIKKDELLRCLSTGEKRALYLLNIIFEIEVRKKTTQETLMVVDDIADSFDYQNKYAIIQYLKDVHSDSLFKQLIMTHNFDFFRTIESRFVKPYSHCLMANKSSTGITLEQATGIRNVFAKDWQCHFADDPRKKIACIPFLRNLIEYTKGETDPKFLTLTSLLQWKPDTPVITEAQLVDIYNEVCGAKAKSKNGTRPVLDLIRTEAEACRTAVDHVRLENKVVLAIGIRLAAEAYMVTKINDPGFVASITANQTQALVERFRKDFGATHEAHVLDRVMIMTPENIHLNSFMYEPIVDMSDEHLRRLYTEVLALA
ncbi:MAG TPA: phage infection protein [Clostridia bacterium]|nr:phage infection protein [Clostridia bacterium]